MAYDGIRWHTMAYDGIRWHTMRQRAKSIGGEGIAEWEYSKAESENSKAESEGTTNGLWRSAPWCIGGKISLYHITSFLAKSVNWQFGKTGYSRNINVF